jgi:cation diffusion facilitator family transporter
MIWYQYLHNTYLYNDGKEVKDDEIPNKKSLQRDFDNDGKTIPFDLIKEGLIAGQKIAKISVITLIGIGIAEILIGYISGSVVALADGIDSLSDAVISFVVLLGLIIANRPADKKFHFGYHKVESFAALMAAIGMVVIGVIIFLNSYQSIIHPHVIKQPVLTMIVLAAAAGISLHRAFQMRNIANKYNILSLKTDAKNSVKDGLASVIGFFSVLIATQFGFLQADALGGMIIASFIFSVAYVSLKRSSLILVDSWQDPKVTDLIKKIIVEKFSYENMNIISVLLRPAGMVVQAEIHIKIDGNKQLNDIELLSLQIDKEIRSKISIVEKIIVVPHSSLLSSALNQSSRTRRWKSGIFGYSNKQP